MKRELRECKKRVKTKFKLLLTVIFHFAILPGVWYYN